MNYKVLNHNYQNTGGGCMVSSFMLYDEAEKRTLFMLLTEEGGTISKADYIMEEIEYSDDLVIDMANFDILQPTDDYFELYRDCLIEHIKKDCSYHRTTTEVRYELLPEKLLNTMTEEYIRWHKAEVGYRFETNGNKIIFADGYSYNPRREDNEIVCIELTREERAKLCEFLYEMLDTYQGGDEYDSVKELLTKI